MKSFFFFYQKGRGGGLKLLKGVTNIFSVNCNLRVGWSDIKTINNDKDLNYLVKMFMKKYPKTNCGFDD